jgi:hypothetical protein
MRTLTVPVSWRGELSSAPSASKNQGIRHAAIDCPGSVIGLDTNTRTRPSECPSSLRDGLTAKMADVIVKQSHGPPLTLTSLLLHLARQVRNGRCDLSYPWLPASLEVVELGAPCSQPPMADVLTRLLDAQSAPRPTSAAHPQPISARQRDSSRTACLYPPPTRRAQPFQTALHPL